MRKLYILSIILLCLCLSASGQNTRTARIIFYNTENLFDTIDDPRTQDEEFLPSAKGHWTSERYDIKLDHIAKVLAAMLDKDQPLVIGLAEVENRQVVCDLIARPALKKFSLGVIEHDSPDPRGIDVALIYNKKLVTIQDTAFLTVRLPDLEKGTRDIVYVKAEVGGKAMHFFVDHWPSRRDGPAASQVRRYAAAMVLRRKINEIEHADPHAAIVVMGDLNDNPIDSSVSFILGAQELIEHPQTLALYDLMLKPYKAGQYSLKYKDENDVFDQFIVTGSLLDGVSTPQVTTPEGRILRQDWMLFKHPKYGPMPNRTYSGPIWHGGYSDHLPVYIDVRY
ncbi:MAG: endonuclease/exonuclease/phosphatase family protein [Bacteroidetes bacterium]|nr:endonuclease/exonuclease/phosphatase family protein [Bacteroidota bacterium]